MLDLGDLPCSGCLIKVLPEAEDSFSAVRVQDFTQLFSQTGTRLLKEEKDP